jgi:hypothetical protein
MPLNPALGDAYRNIVITTGTGSGGVPGTTTARAVDAQFNLDAGYGISLVADPLNNKVTIVNTGNGTGALTTITDSNSNGTFYPIFTRGPTTTITFTTAASDYVSATRPANVAELRITGSINSPTGVAYALRTGLAGLLPGQTFQAVRTSDTATINFTVGTASPINGIPQSSATYSTVTGYWTVTLVGTVGVAETYSSITIPTGVGDINPVTGTYQMDTMYLDQTTTPMSYNPNSSTLSISNLNTNAIVTNSALIGATANFTDWPNAKLVASQANSSDTHVYNMGVVGEAVASSSDSNIWGVGVYGKGSTNVGTRSAGVLGDGGVTNTADTGSAIGVRGYADDTHAGGLNIGLYSSASNSGVNNYALYMNAGNIYSNVAQTWTLADNQASALSLDAAGKTGILVVKTTDAAEGVTMSGTLAVTGRVTVEGVTSTGATGTGKFVFDTAPAIAGGTHTGITSLGIRDTSAAFDVTLAATSSTTLTAGRTLTVDVVNAARTIKLAGNIDIANNLTTSGNFALTLTTTGSTTATFPAGTVTLAASNQTFFLGSTSIAINRASASQSLTGITSIDGYAAGLAGGNATTLLGSLPYQSAANTTSLLSPNTTTTKKFLRQTGDGTNGAAPAWDTLVAGDIPSSLNSTTILSGSLTFSGNISAPAWTTSGIRHVSVPATLTDTTSTGTVANAYSNNFGGNTIAASNTVTFTNYGTVFLNSPTAGTNVTITNPYSLITAGAVLLGGDAVGTATQNVFNTLSTTVNAFGAATTLAVGNTATAAQTVNMFTASTGASTYNFATGATLTATTKTINIGTNGVAGSTTNINIGSSTGGGTTTFNGAVSDAKGGLRAMPQNAQSSAYVLAIADAGKHVSITTGGVTVPSAIFAIGDSITIYNNSGTAQTITQGASVTMYQAGTTNTGNRTLNARGLATVLCVAANTFVITGAGLI